MPINLIHPDVYAQESLTPNFSANVLGNGTTAVFIGPTQRGPIVPTVINSWRQYVQLFGGFNLVGVNGQPVVPSNLTYSVFNYFNNGGQNALILRVTQSGTGQATPQPALSASHTFLDNSATPQPTLAVSAANPGIWGNQIYLDVTYQAPPAGTTSGTFNLTVHYGSSATAAVVEKWTGLSMDPTNPSYAPNLINSVTQGSTFITVTDLADATSPPNNEPATVTGTQLTGGTDGGNPTANDIQSSFSLLDTIPGPLLLNLPGDSNTTDINNLIAYAVNRINQDCFVLVDPPAGASVASVTSFVSGVTVTSYAALYYPWVNIGDPLATTMGATVVTPPGGFIAGQIVSTDTRRGPWKAPAGLTNQLIAASSLQIPGGAFTSANLDSLANSNVNAFRSIPGSGIVVMGAKTLSNVLSTQFVPVRRTLIDIRINLIKRSMFALFEDNDATLWNSVTQVLAQYLTQYWQSGGLAGSAANEAFYVLCDSTNNTAPTIQQGILNIEVGVAPQYPAQFVVITLGLWQGQGTQSQVTQ